MRIYAVLCTAVLIAVAGSTNAWAGAFADSVISYDAGTTAAGGYNNPSNATGSPTRLEFGAAVTPFNPAFLNTDLVSVGNGGHLTLRLSNYALTSTAGLQLGVFAHAGITDDDGYVNFPTDARSASPLVADISNPSNGSMFSVHGAKIEVSADNVLWKPLGFHVIDIPTNAYSDVTQPFDSPAGNSPSDFGQPFTGTLADLENKHLGGTQGMQSIYGSSGGGSWFDLSGTGLSQVGYVRFSLDTADHFELDAVSIGNGFLGAPTPEPATGVLAAMGLAGLLFVARRRWGQRSAAIR